MCSNFEDYLTCDDSSLSPGEFLRSHRSYETFNSPTLSWQSSASDYARPNNPTPAAARVYPGYLQDASASASPLGGDAFFLSPMMSGYDSPFSSDSYGSSREVTSGTSFSPLLLEAPLLSAVLDTDTDQTPMVGSVAMMKTELSNVSSGLQDQHLHQYVKLSDLSAPSTAPSSDDEKKSSIKRVRKPRSKLKDPKFQKRSNLPLPTSSSAPPLRDEPGLVPLNQDNSDSDTAARRPRQLKRKRDAHRRALSTISSDILQTISTPISKPTRASTRRLKGGDGRQTRLRAWADQSSPLKGECLDTEWDNDGPENASRDFSRSDPPSPESLGSPSSEEYMPSPESLPPQSLPPCSSILAGYPGLPMGVYYNESEDLPDRKRSRTNSSIPTPIPIPNLTKKARGRQVPSLSLSISSTDLKRAFVCDVNGCGKAFIRGEHLKRHVRSIHTYETPHLCLQKGCGKSFSRSDNLAQHMKIHERR